MQRLAIRFPALSYVWVWSPQRGFSKIRTMVGQKPIYSGTPFNTHPCRTLLPHHWAQNGSVVEIPVARSHLLNKFCGVTCSSTSMSYVALQSANPKSHTTKREFRPKLKRKNVTLYMRLVQVLLDLQYLFHYGLCLCAGESREWFVGLAMPCRVCVLLALFQSIS
jgi:hypothetical protein